MALAHLPVAMCVYRRYRQTSTVQDQRGFTLIEVMIAVAIVGILVMVAIPNYMQWNARYQLKQGTTELAGSLNLARMAAMNRNLAVTVTLALVSGKVNVDFGGALSPILLPQSIIAFTGGPTTSPCATISAMAAPDKLMTFSYVLPFGIPPTDAVNVHPEVFITGSTIDTASGPASAPAGAWSWGSSPTGLTMAPMVALHVPTAAVVGSVAL